MSRLEEREEKKGKTYVVESDVLRHRPELETDAANLVEVSGRVVFEVVRVRDLARGPGALVSGVVDEGSEPVTLVVGCVWREERGEEDERERRGRESRKGERERGRSDQGS